MSKSKVWIVIAESLYSQNDDILLAAFKNEASARALRDEFQEYQNTKPDPQGPSAYLATHLWEHNHPAGVLIAAQYHLFTVVSVPVKD